MIRKLAISLLAMLSVGAGLASAGEILTRKGYVPQVGGATANAAPQIDSNAGLAAGAMMAPKMESPQTPEALIDSLAGIKHSRDGTDTVIEASPRLKMMLKARGQISPVRPAKGQLVQIKNTKVSPYASMGMIMSGCSGALVMKRYVLTAPWCVYDAKAKKFYENLDFVPALNGNDAPVGTIKWKNAWIPKAFQDSGDLTFAYGLIELESDIGDQVGWFGFGPTQGSGNVKQLALAGYPFDGVPKNTMWEANCSIDSNEENAYFYHCPGDGKTLVSMMGSPFFAKGAKEGDAGQILGIHVSSQDDKQNSFWAMKLNDAHTQTILAWANGGDTPPEPKTDDNSNDQGNNDNPQCTCDKSSGQ